MPVLTDFVLLCTDPDYNYGADRSRDGFNGGSNCLYKVNEFLGGHGALRASLANAAPELHIPLGKPPKLRCRLITSTRRNAAIHAGW